MDRIFLFAQSKAGIVIMALVALLVLERLFPVALVSRPFRRIGD